MLRMSYLNAATIAAITVLGLTSYAVADPLMDHLRNDPSVINRSTTNNPNMKMLRDPEFTGSLRVEGADRPLTTICSYDSFYWNTIYACNPDYNPADPVFIEKERDHHGGNNSLSTPN